MSDVVDPATRSRMMSGIRAADTKPELQIRRLLHGAGYRYRLHERSLPGSPDLVLRKYRAVVFIHGCFWHGHGCHLFKWPTTRREFWEQKIESNQVRDQRTKKALQHSGWRTLTVWECALKGRYRWAPEDLLRALEGWLVSDVVDREIAGHVSQVGGQVPCR